MFKSIVDLNDIKKCDAAKISNLLNFEKRLWK